MNTFPVLLQTFVSTKGTLLLIQQRSHQEHRHHKTQPFRLHPNNAEPYGHDQYHIPLYETLLVFIKMKEMFTSSHERELEDPSESTLQIEELISLHKRSN